jgi:hypothetical protein
MLNNSVHQIQIPMQLVKGAADEKRKDDKLKHSKHGQDQRETHRRKHIGIQGKRMGIDNGDIKVLHGADGILPSVHFHI